MNDIELQYNLLDQVLTFPEVARSWGKSNSSIYMAIWKGKLIARQSNEGRAWLISKQSVISLWGEPSK